MIECYAFNSQAAAQAALDNINGQSYFPIRGKNRGVDASDDKAKTVTWQDAPWELVSGGWVVKRVPTTQLDFVGVSSGARASFLAAFGQNVRNVAIADIIRVPDNG
jgi:hypothetical protein